MPRHFRLLALFASQELQRWRPAPPAPLGQTPSTRHSASLGVRLIILATLAGGIPHSSSGDQFTLSLVHHLNVNAVANGAAGAPVQQQDQITTRAEGQEQSDPFMLPARHSLGTATSRFRPDATQSQSVAFGLTATAYANGGHLAKIGGSGQDTVGLSRAVAGATATIAFDQTARPFRYRLIVAATGNSSGNTVFHYTLTDSQGNTIRPNETGSTELLLTSAPGRVFQIDFQLVADAQNSGACCFVTSEGQRTITVMLHKAAILDSQREEGLTHLAPDGARYRMIGGQVTDAYTYVGAVFFDGRLHCSGTLIGKHTVLTAAHCLADYDATRLTFRVGTYAWADDVRELHGETAAIPDDQNFRYDRSLYRDDIGLLYLTDEAPLVFTRLHIGTPPLATLQKARKVLSFVGYGYDYVENAPGDPGYRRQAEMPISSVMARQFRYEVPNTNTCDGDSGGPAFFVAGKQRYLAGVTSYGDEHCTQYGVDTRVDAYARWLKGRIR